MVLAFSILFGGGHGCVSCLTKLFCQGEKLHKARVTNDFKSQKKLYLKQKKKGLKKHNSRYSLLFPYLNTDPLVDYLHMARRTGSLGVLCCHHTNR
jgi:hypothetical protein